MRTRGWTKAAVALAAAGLLAAACGGDDDDSGAGGATTTAAAGGATTTTGAGGVTTAAGGGAATTAASGATGDFGQDPDDENIYKGAGDFQIDISDCPGDWDINQGISDTEIKVAGSLPKSGPVAGFGLIADGMQSYFDYQAEAEGGVGGRKIVFEAADDAYDPKRTQTNIDEALGSGDYAAFSTIIGTPNNLAVWDVLNEECMPQLLNGTGAVQWGDVENHPWTTGMQIDYFTEAKLWVEWLKSEFPDGATIAALTFNNDFGKSYSAGLKSALEDAPGFELVKEELHDGTAPNVTNQMTSLAATDADVLLLQTTAVYCTQGMAEVEKGAWKPKVMMSATCASLSQFFQPLIDQGLTGEGTYMIQFAKDPNDPAFADDPFVKLFHATLAEQGLDSKQTTYGTGWLFAWYLAEIMKLAETYNGGLNRANIMVAARSIQATSPSLIEGLTNKMEGQKDAYLNEGGRIAQYTITDPKQLGSFKPVGEVVDLEGQLGTYAAVQEAMGG
jgi:branched-chain amino acid transport system substrate-binding protein